MPTLPATTLDLDDRPHPLSGALTREWLEADGLGGFSSGTAAGIRTRRYHGLLLVATRPPADRVLLVADVEAWIETDAGRFALSSTIYRPEVMHPDGAAATVAFSSWPWPRWTSRLPDATRIDAELVVPRGRPAVVLRWTRTEGSGKARLCVRPRLAPRDPHATHRDNAAIHRGMTVQSGVVRWPTYADLPAVDAMATGRYEHAPLWFRDCLLVQERARGLDDVEDLYSPGEWTFDLADGPAVLVLGTPEALADLDPGDVRSTVDHLYATERGRRTSRGRRLVAADAYIADAPGGPAILAGYPWFGEWGRDAFIAARGLLIATGRLDDAAAMLERWADTVRDGLLPNRLPDRGTEPEYNSVDASLWYGVVVHELLRAMQHAGRPLDVRRARRLMHAVDAVIDGFLAGTRHGIAVDSDGLVRAGEPGVQLTWMDARVDGREVTPRVGKPVEIQALWLTLLTMASLHRSDVSTALARGRASFLQRFTRPDVPWLADVVDVDHIHGQVDATLRPNQVYALGGLPLVLLSGPRGSAALQAVETALVTPMGLRTLAPDDPRYVGRYAGGVASRDGAYHQGTVWPHLLGPFVDAWVRQRGDTPTARAEARARFLAPLHRHLAEAGLDHVSELADGDAPHEPGGAPFQAWGLAELLRATASLSMQVAA